MYQCERVPGYAVGRRPLDLPGGEELHGHRGAGEEAVGLGVVVVGGGGGGLVIVGGGGEWWI